MKETKKLHSIQMDILRVLMFRPEARFADLNVPEISNDHFTFHVKRLLKLGLVEKNEKGKYQLTDAGKEFANRFDTDSQEIVLEKQAKIGVAICCIKKIKGIKKYLIQQRLKQPYYGFYGFMTGKVRWGETVEETAKRELKEETGLMAQLSLAGIKHKMDYSNKKKLLEDKYFFIFRGDNPKGKLIESFEGGKNFWLTEQEIKKLPDLFDGVDEVVKMIGRNKLVFKEIKYIVSGY